MDFWNKLGRAAQMASDKANIAVELVKLNIKIRSEKAAIAKAKTQMGELIWKNYLAGETLQPELVELCSDIDESLALIDILRTEIEIVKNQDSDLFGEYGCDCGCEDEACDCGCEGEACDCGCEDEACECGCEDEACDCGCEDAQQDS